MCVPPKLIDLDLKGIDTVAVDLETYDPDLKKTRLDLLSKFKNFTFKKF